MATALVSAAPISQPPPSLSQPPKGHRQRYAPVPPQKSTTPGHHTQGRHDVFYGQETISRICHRFITFLFTCPDHPPTPLAANNPQAKLPYFIAYALHRTKLNQSVTIAALILLQRLKARFPTAKGSSGHRLFVSSFMIASKVICDDTYSNKSWSIVAQNIFSLREINQMEREMCGYLDWELNIDGSMLAAFEERLFADFGADHSHYPKYDVAMVSKRSARIAASTSATPLPDPHPTTSAIPNFGNSRNPTPAKPPQPPSHSSTSTWHSPAVPDTPSPSYSNSTSPTTSPEPITPPGTEDFTARIRGHDHSPQFSCVQDLPNIHPLKAKMFAMAIGSEW